MSIKSQERNPWERALLTAGAPNASSLTMQGGLTRVQGRMCPRCGGQMSDVLLASGKRKAMYCNRDRVVIPLPVEE